MATIRPENFVFVHDLQKLMLPSGINSIATEKTLFANTERAS